MGMDRRKIIEIAEKEQDWESLQAHQEELPIPHYTWLRILAGQMGVGGDDSWGAPVHSQYLLSSEKDWKTEFVIEQKGIHN